MSVRLVRKDEQLGVEFNSTEILTVFLELIKGSNDPSLRHFIPVLENGGVIPKNDISFQALIDSMGISIYAIPNAIRAHFLVTFQGGTKMQMTWWETTPSDRRRDFIAYLKKASELKDLPPQLVEDQARLKLLIIPTLEEGDGWIPEDMDHVLELAQRWQMTNFQLADEIRQLWERMAKPISAQKAGQIIGRSAGTMRKYARKEVVHADIDRKGHWYFTREVLIDRFN